MMIIRLKILLQVLISLMLLASAGSSYAQNVDCRACHAPGSTSGAADFSAVYAKVASHHPVDINYPLGLGAEPYFHQPNAQRDDITYFDKNGNGQPDSNEIQLFAMNSTAKITCSTCHRDHGATALPANAPRDTYLRVTIIGSALCSNCHNK